MSAGRKIADQTGEELAAVLFGRGVSELATSLSKYDTDKFASVF